MVVFVTCKNGENPIKNEVARVVTTFTSNQWATIAHLGACIMFGYTIIDDAQRQVTLNLKQ